jgi:Clr5 domain
MDREQWARLKDTIRQLYIDQNLHCKQVAAILREQHDDRVRYVPTRTVRPF